MRFATIGTSDICRRFIEALGQVEGGSYELCYSRHAQTAKAFAQENGAARTCTSLDDLAADPQVDAVYIASPNALHASQARLLLAQGKHVLVEKSFASNEAEAVGIFDLAQEKGLVAMEAMRNIHDPSFAKVSEVVNDQLGQVRAASLGFSKITSRFARLKAGERLNVFDPRMASGALMDIGVYVVEPAVALFGAPQEVLASAVTTEVPGEEAESPYGRIDISGSALLSYGDFVVNLNYGKVTDDVIACQVQGERATLTFRTVSCPEDLRLYVHQGDKMVYKMETGAGEPIPVPSVPNDMVFEIRDFMAAVGEGAQGPLASRYRQVTLDSLRVQDRIRQQVGIRFPADEG